MRRVLIRTTLNGGRYVGREATLLRRPEGAGKAVIQLDEWTRAGSRPMDGSTSSPAASSPRFRRGISARIARG